MTQATAVDKGGKIYLIGGCTVPFVPTSLVQIYNPVTDTWSAGAPMPTPRAALAVGVLGNTIYAIGGTDFAPGNLTVVEGYDRIQDQWSGPLTAKPTAASEIFAAAHGGALYVPGSGAFGLALGINEVFRR